MQEIIAVGFTGKHRASEVLGELLALNDAWVVDLYDAVTVYRTSNGRLRVDQSVQPTTGEGFVGGGLLGSLLGGLLAAPFTLGASAAVAAGAVGAAAIGGGAIGSVAGAEDADWSKNTFGLPEGFVQDVGGMVQPGESAIIALIRTSDPEILTAHFKGYGGRVLRTTLTPSDSARVERALKAR